MISHKLCMAGILLNFHTVLRVLFAFDLSPMHFLSWWVFSCPRKKEITHWRSQFTSSSVEIGNACLGGWLKAVRREFSANWLEITGLDTPASGSGGRGVFFLSNAHRKVNRTNYFQASPHPSQFPYWLLRKLRLICLLTNKPEDNPRKKDLT